MSVVILVADGARPDTLAAAMDDGALPAMGRLREEGALSTITSVFPSVTGPAYAPFLMGRHPGPVGLPGLRWYDRERRATAWPAYSRSYVGPEMRHVDRDLNASAPTMFELAERSIAALSVIRRGLHPRDQIGRTASFAARTALTHFRGNVTGWLNLDREVSGVLTRRIREERPDFAFAAFTGVDKTSHATGHTSPLVRDAMRIVDDTAARIRADAERDGRWNAMQLWIVSDHGHSPVHQHEDLAQLLCDMDLRVLTHPVVFTRAPDVAVMVSGNAMAHLYFQLGARTPPGWRALRESRCSATRRRSSSAPARWCDVITALLELDSVDLALLPHARGECELMTRERGSAVLRWSGGQYSYNPVSGDPLGIGQQDALDADAAYDATISSDYPDALVQIASIADAPRSGDVILSAARGWDFRARYEPIPHVSSHGALHREHMLVPLLTNRVPSRPPRRTVDVMPSALHALGIAIPHHVDGNSFY